MYKVCCNTSLMRGGVRACREKRLRDGGWFGAFGFGRVHSSGRLPPALKAAALASCGCRFVRWHASRRDGCKWGGSSAPNLSLAAGARPQLLPAVRLQGRLRWRPEHGLWHDLRQSGGRQEVRAQVPPDAGAFSRCHSRRRKHLAQDGTDAAGRRASDWLHAGLDMRC